MATGGRLPDPAAAELLDTARSAFTQGLEVAGAISAGIAVAAAVLAVALLRRVGAPSEPDRAPALGRGGLAEAC